MISNLELSNFFNDLEWETVEIGGSWYEITPIQNLIEESVLLYHILKKQEINLDGYTYSISGGFVRRYGVKVQRKTEEKSNWQLLNR